jgi:hypothetical protein
VSDKPVPPPDPRLIAAALVRQQGRVRVTARELAEVVKGHLGVKRLDDGTLVLEFREGTLE